MTVLEPGDGTMPDDAEAMPGAGARTEPRIDSGWRRTAAGSLAFLRRRLTGNYAIDDYGYDPDFYEHVVLPPLRMLYEKWFSGTSCSASAAAASSRPPFAPEFRSFPARSSEPRRSTR